MGGILFRIQGEGGAGTWDGYRVNIGSTSADIDRADNGVFTNLISIASTWAVGDKVGVRMEGSTIQAWQMDVSVSSDWNLVGSAVDTTYPNAGKIGISG